jgi:hypothetical protein
MDTTTLEAPRRRDVLRLLLFSSAATSVVTVPAIADAKKKRKPGKLVFRLQTRRHHSCNACKQHHRFTMFRTQALADANRAHPGCNCPITSYKLPIKPWKKLFGKKGVAPLGVADLRRTPLPHGKG